MALFISIAANVYIFNFWREVKSKWEDVLPLTLILIFSLSIFSPLFDIITVLIFQDYYIGYQTSLGIFLQNIFRGNELLLKHIYTLLSFIVFVYAFTSWTYKHSIVKYLCYGLITGFIIFWSYLKISGIEPFNGLGTISYNTSCFILITTGLFTFSYFITNSSVPPTHNPYFFIVVAVALAAFCNIIIHTYLESLPLLRVLYPVVNICKNLTIIYGLYQFKKYNKTAKKKIGEILTHD